MSALPSEPRPLLVPCTEGAAHAFLRPNDCPTCEGRGWRPAEEVELVHCDEGWHEHELRTDEQPPTLEGLVPLHEALDGVVWECSYRGCDGSIILTRAGA